MKKIILLIVFLISYNLFAASEFSFDFGYDRQIYGNDRQNSFITRNYTIGLTHFLFDQTAIDLSYSNNTEINTQNDRFMITGVYDVISIQSTARTYVYGLGIKQILVPRGSLLTPILSIGYAKQYVTSSSTMTIEDVTDLSRYYRTSESPKQTYNSISAAFILQLKLSETISIKGTVRTLFKAFQYNDAKDNIKYLVGFSWVF